MLSHLSGAAVSAGCTTTQHVTSTQTHTHTHALSRTQCFFSSPSTRDAFLCVRVQPFSTRLAGIFHSSTMTMAMLSISSINGNEEIFGELALFGLVVHLVIPREGVSVRAGQNLENCCWVGNSCGRAGWKDAFSYFSLSPSLCYSRAMQCACARRGHDERGSGWKWCVNGYNHRPQISECRLRNNVLTIQCRSVVNYN